MFECFRCLKKFASNYNLQRHLAKKNQCIRIYKCKRCGESFRDDTDLQRHMDRKYPCNPENQLEKEKIDLEKTRLEIKMKELELKQMEIERKIQETENRQIRHENNILIQENIEKRRAEKHSIYIQNNTTNNNINIQNNIFLSTPPGPNVLPFNDETKEIAIKQFKTLSLDKVINIIGHPNTENHRKIANVIGWIHNNDEMPHLKNIILIDNKYYGPQNNNWIEIPYSEVRKIILHEVFVIFIGCETKCDEIVKNYIELSSEYKTKMIDKYTENTLMSYSKDLPNITNYMRQLVVYKKMGSKEREAEIKKAIDEKIKPDMAANLLE